VSQQEGQIPDTANVVINLATGLEDPQRVTAAFLVAGDALAGVAIADAAPDAVECVARLEPRAARGDMRELAAAVRSHPPSHGARVKPSPTETTTSGAAAPASDRRSR
jgi:hypothetical protein